jgi:hypothetical protein
LKTFDPREIYLKLRIQILSNIQWKKNSFSIKLIASEGNVYDLNGVIVVNKIDYS